MSEHDPFATPTADTPDPFADPPQAPAPTPQPEPTPEPQPEPTPAPAPQPEPVSPESPGVREPEPPLVDREGAPVEVTPGPLATEPEDAEVAADVAPAPPQPTAADTGELNQAADHMAGEPQGEPQAAVEAPQAPAETQTEGGGQPPQEPPAAPPATSEPDASSGSESGGTEGESNGTTSKSKLRHYVVLMQTGPTTFEVIALDASSDYVTEIEEEGVKGRYLAARNNEHAYKLAYHLVGAPQGGATLLPLPKGSWRPRRVAPAPPQPERERLVIQ